MWQVNKQHVGCTSLPFRCPSYKLECMKATRRHPFQHIGIKYTKQKPLFTNKEFLMRPASKNSIKCDYSSFKSDNSYSLRICHVSGDLLSDLSSPGEVISGRYRWITKCQMCNLSLAITKQLSKNLSTQVTKTRQKLRSS